MRFVLKKNNEVTPETKKAILAAVLKLEVQEMLCVGIDRYAGRSADGKEGGAA